MGHSGSETKTKSARAKLKSRLPIGNPTYVLRPDKGFWLLLRRHVGPRSPCWVHVAILGPGRHVGLRSPRWVHVSMLDHGRHVGSASPCWALRHRVGLLGAMLNPGRHVGARSPC